MKRSVKGLSWAVLAAFTAVMVCGQAGCVHAGASASSPAESTAGANPFGSRESGQQDPATERLRGLLMQQLESDAAKLEVKGLTDKGPEDTGRAAISRRVFVELCDIITKRHAKVDTRMRMRAAQWLLSCNAAMTDDDRDVVERHFDLAMKASTCHRVRSVMEVVGDVMYARQPEWVERLAERIEYEKQLESYEEALQRPERRPGEVGVTGLEKAVPVAPVAPLPWSPYEHWFDLTKPVLQARKWKMRLVAEVVDANIATDLVWMNDRNAKWFYRMTVPFFVSAKKKIPQVGAFCASFRAYVVDASARSRVQLPDACAEPHFDDLFRYREFVQYRRLFDEWAIREARRIARLWAVDPRGARSQFLCLLGLVHHAVQDFYCHANWVDLFRAVRNSPHASRYGMRKVQCPTWQDLHDLDSTWSKANRVLRGDLLARFRESDDRIILARGWANRRHLGGLQSGRWHRKCDEKAWKHLHPRGDVHKDGLEVSRRATAEWTERLLAVLPLGATF